MIRKIQAWQDSQGGIHDSIEAALRVELRAALEKLLGPFEVFGANDEEYVPVNRLLDHPGALEKALADAGREDTSVRFVEPEK